MKSYVDQAGLDLIDTITEARIEAWLTVAQCIELCDISERTWYRWMRNGAPRWAIRLVMSQGPALDRFGWKDWEIRKGLLHYKQLSYRYHWTPAQLILPLYNARESHLAWSGTTDNLSAIETARETRKTA
jgi:hypothetical protein